jgi:hypothetical protein
MYSLFRNGIVAYYGRDFGLSQLKGDFMKVVLGIPHYDHFGKDFFVSFTSLYLDTCIKKNGIDKVYWIMEESAYIHKSRNSIFKQAQDIDADYLFMIDCDMKFPSDALERMIALDKDIVAGVYYMRGYPHLPMVYEWIDNNDFAHHRNLVKIPTEPFKADSVGSGFLLISKKVLDGYTKDTYKKHGKPFSHKIYDDGLGGDTVGEDTSFCMRMRELGYEIWADPTIELGHIGKLEVNSGIWAIAKNQVLTNTGWTTEEELLWLHESAKKYGTIVEVGSWKGQSTKALLGGNSGVVHAVDHFKGSPTDKSRDYAMVVQDVYKEFIENTKGYNNLVVHKKSSAEAVSSFEDNSVDMVWIDAGHTYEECGNDIDMWLPKIKKGGIISGHDYCDKAPGVMQAVNDRFKIDGLVDTIWYKRVA